MSCPPPLRTAPLLRGLTRCAVFAGQPRPSRCLTVGPDSDISGHTSSGLGDERPLPGQTDRQIALLSISIEADILLCPYQHNCGRTLQFLLQADHYDSLDKNLSAPAPDQRQGFELACKRHTMAPLFARFS